MILLLTILLWQPEEVVTFPSELEADTIICLERIAFYETEHEVIIWTNPINELTAYYNFVCTYHAMSFKDFQVWNLSNSGYTTWIMVSTSFERWDYFKSILTLECD